MSINVEKKSTGERLFLSVLDTYTTPPLRGEYVSSRKNVHPCDISNRQKRCIKCLAETRRIDSWKHNESPRGNTSVRIASDNRLYRLRRPVVLPHTMPCIFPLKNLHSPQKCCNFAFDNSKGAYNTCCTRVFQQYVVKSILQN